MENLRFISFTLSVFVFFLGFYSNPVQSIQFDLQSGHSKCISEDMNVNAMSVGKYHIVDPNKEGHKVPDSLKLTVRVTSPYGNTMHQADHVESGVFAFTSAEAGDYMTCFWVDDHKPPATNSIEFEWRTGVVANDWTNVAKKGKIDMMEQEFRRLEDTVKSIHEEMFHLRSREEEMQELNRTTNSRMAWLSFLSLLFTLSVAGMQVWHLKTFFERKKLL